LGYLSAILANGHQTFILSPNLQEAQKHIVSLRLEKGKAMVNNEKVSNPQNMAAYLFENYIHFYEAILIQNKSSIQTFLDSKEEQIKRLKNIDPKSPYRLFAQAEVYLQSAFVKGMNEEYLSSAWDLRTSYLLLEENSKLFPNFVTNKKDIGFLKALLGTVPDSYQFIVNIAGMKGDLKKGMQMLKEYAENADENEILMERKNAQYFYTVFNLFYLKDSEESWRLGKKYTSDYKTNLLSNYIRAFIAKGTANNETAIETIRDRPTNKD
jgi:hypothetical protein